MMKSTVFALFLLNAWLQMSNIAAFSMQSSRFVSRSVLKMEYIPDGLTKEQWALIKKKEAEELKLKGDQGALGVRKFKSRSFEAWHKAGAKHLFPVDPKTAKYEERPYMQRKNGDWEGNDLKAVGLQGQGQGSAAKRLDIDDLYEGMAKKGSLNSISIFGGAPLPWTNEAVSKIGTVVDKASAKPAVANKQLSPEEMARLKATLFKPKVTPKPTDTKEAAPAATKKGFFGLF